MFPFPEAFRCFQQVLFSQYCFHPLVALCSISRDNSHSLTLRGVILEVVGNNLESVVNSDVVLRPLCTAMGELRSLAYIVVLQAHKLFLPQNVFQWELLPRVSGECEVLRLCHHWSEHREPFCKPPFGFNISAPFVLEELTVHFHFINWC